MKKIALVVPFALGMSAGAAQAQTDVDIYGILDAAIVGERASYVSQPVKLTSGAASASRIGFRGTEDLGGGLSAFFTLETGTKIDTGAIDSANTLFNRQAFVGLKGSFGAVALGRQYTPWHLTLAAFDPFGTGYAGTSKNLFPDSGVNIRTSNTITWKSPVVNGVDGELAYTAGEQAGDSSAGRQFGAALGYTDGPLALRAAYNNKNSDVVANGAVAAVKHDLGRNAIVAASYNFTEFTLHAIYNADKGYNSAPLWNVANLNGVVPTATTDARDMLLGVSAPLGQGKLMFSVMHKDDRTALNQDATSWGLGYLYSLSKRTGLYAAYAHIDNKNGAGYTVANNSETGTGATGYNLGIRHTF